MGRIRVSELSNEIGVHSSTIIKVAKSLGLQLKTPSSSITHENAEILNKFILTSNVSDLPDFKTLIKHENTNLTSQSINEIKLTISNLKSIKSFEWSFKFEKGIMAIIGANGIGKSSFIISLAKLVSPQVFQYEFIGSGYKNTTVKYTFNNNTEYIWKKNPSWTTTNLNGKMVKVDGFFESSILSGKRFKIYNKLKEIEVDTKNDSISPASAFICKNMNYVMHGDLLDNGKFSNLQKIHAIRRRRKPDGTYEDAQYHFFALPNNDHYINEYFFSTGEYFLLSLLKFIESFIDSQNKKFRIIVIDEIELSLHSLAQKRLIEVINKFVENCNILVVFSTHSLQIIESMNPNDIFHFENDNGICNISSPCYPGFLNSRLHYHQFYDRIILVEDDLAEMFIIEMLKTKLLNNILYKIIPIGGWEKVLDTYSINEKQRFYGNATVLVILDGDVRARASKNKYSEINKSFLPLENIEKYVVSMLFEKDRKFISFIEGQIMPKRIKDLNFTIKSLDKTDHIKDGYFHFIKAVSDERSNINVDGISREIIQYILKENIDLEKYKNFADRITTFLT